MATGARDRSAAHAMRVVAHRPDPNLLRLPWGVPLEEWGEPHVVPLPRGISRHVVRIVRAEREVYAVKETQEPIAFREYRLLRDLQRLGLPAVVPAAVVTGRRTPEGEDLPVALVTRHLRFSLPYRSLFGQGSRGRNAQELLETLVDALVVLLARLHLSGFFWGDVSLSNVLFRRSAGDLAAYLVDAETGELHPELTDGQRRHDVTLGTENVFAEILDLQAGDLMSTDVDPHLVVDRITERYEDLWGQLTGTEEFTPDEMWRIEQRVARLNDMGFDVAELDIVADWNGSTVRIQPRVVESGHHRRELLGLTGMDVEDNQARRLLNDLASFTAHHDLGDEDRGIVAGRWLTTVYEPITAMIPHELRGRLEPAEVFHEILEHRWYLSERAGREVDIFDAARSYIDSELAQRPVEDAVTDAQ
ncbi:DUF4032 domain-containing protein [Nocardioides massiliensis]|uniref:DUF4032 domain-containing protein n=1 Tax=Nocardioides massiliensis TaxID=1325935 RepID=A0ABT9NJN7_9ACTN|nr:DUF4032 domain-containing protein [Nocardioides massiliensis]MDP9820627.1 hypothetical protein [Nocardioides massiliensis]